MFHFIGGSAVCLFKACVLKHNDVNVFLDLNFYFGGRLKQHLKNFEVNLARASLVFCSFFIRILLFESRSQGLLIIVKHL